MNAITDVAGVAVGHVTLIEGEGKLVPGKGPIRTGVTAILPRPRGNWDPVFAATFNQNGNGDMTGINWIKESGFLEGPILLTGTHSVGTVRDAAIQWQLKNGREFIFTYPIVAETFDFLNDANGEHVKAAHAFEALDRAKPGPRRRRCGRRRYGNGLQRIQRRHRHRVARADSRARWVHHRRVGAMQLRWRPANPRRSDSFRDHRPSNLHGTSATVEQALDGRHSSVLRQPDVARANDGSVADHEGRGSIIVIVATDAPLLPHQLERIARRVSLGLGRLGSFAGNSSGDLFLAFSTANAGAAKPEGTPALSHAAQ